MSGFPTPNTPAPPAATPGEKYDGNIAEPESPRSTKQFIPLTEEEVLLQQLLKRFNISKRELVGMIATGKIEVKRKKTGRKEAIDEMKASNILALALVGLRPATVARILGIEYMTMHNYLKKHPEFKAMFESNRMSRFQNLMAKAWQQVNNGYWPAIEFMLKNFYGDFMKEQTRGNKPGEPDEPITGERPEDIEQQIEVKVTKYKRNIDKNILKEIEDDDDDDEAVRVDRMTPRDLGEAIDAEFEEMDGKKDDETKGQGQTEDESQSEKTSSKKAKGKTKGKEGDGKNRKGQEPIPDYY